MIKNCNSFLLKNLVLLKVYRFTLKLAGEPENKGIEKIVQSLRTFSGVEKVVLFGSRVCGDFSGSSDIDILIVISDIKLKNRVISILHDIELEFDLPISPVIFTSREYEINKKLKSSFIENIEKEGIVLYDYRNQR